MMRMKMATALVATLVACGGSKQSNTTVDNHGDLPPDDRTEIERRRDAACAALGPRLTECAIADARATMTPEELAKLAIEETAPKHTEEFIESCQAQALSSRQVRVYEVCLREESACEPLIACLDNARPDAASP